MADRTSIFTLEDADSGDATNGSDSTDNSIAGAESNGSRPSLISPELISASEGSGNDTGNSPAGSSTGGKKRGRKAGSTNKTKNNPSIDVEGFAGILLSSHAMLAAILKTDELNLDEKEAQELAKATAMVSRHYDVKVAAKTVDWTRFIMCVGGVYGLRLIAIRNRVINERRAKRANEPVQGNAMFDANGYPIGAAP